MAESKGTNVSRKEQTTIWIIRFADGILASHYGTYGSAERVAEERKEDHGGGYVIG